MRIYQFHFFDPRGNVPALDLAEYEDDGAASRSAMKRLDDHASCQGVELYEGDRLVLRVERAGGVKHPNTFVPDQIIPV
ncbi:hypothetical protein [uncultured Brevundimonas sp.]|uniref:hypothetical protein n=1 Tax=uncultured Brevundimonas sp. TaxID=213418 RepID=UPI0025D2A7C4|nr:hypothetical protein [uncultured Brevundimonas sp.]